MNDQGLFTCQDCGRELTPDQSKFDVEQHAETICTTCYDYHIEEAKSAKRIPDFVSIDQYRSDTDNENASFEDLRRARAEGRYKDARMLNPYDAKDRAEIERLWPGMRGKLPPMESAPAEENADA